MFDNFPKVRQPLPAEIEKIYTTQYKSNREGDTPAASASQRMEAWLHKNVAADLKNKSVRELSTLELGAGTLNQLEHEPAVGPYDIVEPFTELFQNSPLMSRIRNVYADISDIALKPQYDRITSIATLEHVCNLPELVARCGLLLKENGTMRSAIPNEGTILWKLGWQMTTGLEFKLKHGLDYGILMKYEHVNTANEIEKVLSYFFEKVNYKVFGVSKCLGLYRFYACSQPNIERCIKFALG